MLCLALSDVLFQEGLSAIPHGCTEQVYHRTLSADFDVVHEVLAVELDIQDLGMGDEPPALTHGQRQPPLAQEQGVFEAQAYAVDDDDDAEWQEAFAEVLQLEGADQDSVDSDDAAVSPQNPTPAQLQPVAPYHLPAAFGLGQYERLKKKGRMGLTLRPKQPHSGGGPYGGWEAECPFHCNNQKSGCRKWNCLSRTNS